MLAVSTVRHNGRAICNSSRIVRLGEQQPERKPLLPHTLAILRAQVAHKLPVGVNR
ncbi:MAG: hypothetical protein KGL39_42550 [Patescibacteria group bacterium]|nr:hypothetical protein [Patescibacteria group bacterium]